MPPKESQKLQPSTPNTLGNVGDRYYRAGNVEGMKRIGQELQDRIQNHPSLQPGTGYLLPNTQEPWNNPGPGSYWNAGLQSGGNSGIMSAAMADTSPDFQGNWLMNSPWGHRLLGLLSGRHGEEGTSEQLIDMIGRGGIDLWGGTLSPKWGDDGYGFNWEIGLGG